MSFPRESSSVLTNSPHSGIFFFNISFYFYQGFPDSSVGKKFASNVGVMGLIPGLGAEILHAALCSLKHESGSVSRSAVSSSL